MEVNLRDPQETIELFWRSFSSTEEVKQFATRIVEGVYRQKEAIDTLIDKYSEHWRLDRMDWVDRNILRMGVYELMYCDDIPINVALNEAIDLGKKFGSEESGAFINGILDRLSKIEGRVTILREGRNYG
jgi:N utilization substance protein B